jgi:hypothetical protein
MYERIVPLRVFFLGACVGESRFARSHGSGGSNGEDSNHGRARGGLSVKSENGVEGESFLSFSFFLLFLLSVYRRVCLDHEIGLHG